MSRGQQNIGLPHKSWNTTRYKKCSSVNYFALACRAKASELSRTGSWNEHAPLVWRTTNVMHSAGGLPKGPLPGTRDEPPTLRS
jgi:hypothetical protein